jgi:Fungal N-terminal domain of STAND proteins
MAEIGVASGVIALVTFAFQSSQVLYQTVDSFRSQKREVRELKNELQSLTPVLDSLKQVSSVDKADADFGPLKVPLYQCGIACRDFRILIEGCVSRSEQDRKSFRDWARLKYKGDNIDEFRKMIAAYKSTINLAIGHINL